MNTSEAFKYKLIMVNIPWYHSLQERLFIDGVLSPQPNYYIGGSTVQ